MNILKKLEVSRQKKIIKDINNEIKNFRLIKPINATMEDIIKNTINKVA